MDNPQLLNKIKILINDNNKDISPRKLLVAGDSVSEYIENSSLLPGEKVVEFYRKDFSEYLSLIKEAPGAVYYTAEQWLDLQGFNSLRLVTLLDLENKLTALNKDSAKLSSVRGWINQILASFIQNPTARSDWPVTPFPFEDTIQEVFNEINM